MWLPVCAAVCIYKYITLALYVLTMVYLPSVYNNNGLLTFCIHYQWFTCLLYKISMVYLPSVYTINGLLTFCIHYQWFTCLMYTISMVYFPSVYNINGFLTFCIHWIDWLKCRINESRCIERYNEIQVIWCVYTYDVILFHAEVLKTCSGTFHPFYQLCIRPWCTRFSVHLK